MKYFLKLAALGTLLTLPAQADHHGRGQEQLNGFPGIYTVGDFGTITFTDDGYLVTVTNAKVAAGIMTYEVSQGVLTLKDVSPPAFFPAAARDCMREKAATYTMTDMENGFSLSILDEPCPPRAGLLDGSVFTDYVKPE